MDGNDQVTGEDKSKEEIEVEEVDDTNNVQKFADGDRQLTHTSSEPTTTSHGHEQSNVDFNEEDVEFVIADVLHGSVEACVVMEEMEQERQSGNIDNVPMDCSDGSEKIQESTLLRHDPKSHHDLSKYHRWIEMCPPDCINRKNSLDGPSTSTETGTETENPCQMHVYKPWRRRFSVQGPHEYLFTSSVDIETETRVSSACHVNMERSIRGSSCSYGSSPIRTFDMRVYVKHGEAKTNISYIANPSTARQVVHPEYDQFLEAPRFTPGRRIADLVVCIPVYGVHSEDNVRKSVLYFTMDNASQMLVNFGGVVVYSQGDTWYCHHEPNRVTSMDGLCGGTCCDKQHTLFYEYAVNYNNVMHPLSDRFQVVGLCRGRNIYVDLKDPRFLDLKTMRMIHNCNYGALHGPDAWVDYVLRKKYEKELGINQREPPMENLKFYPAIQTFGIAQEENEKEETSEQMLVRYYHPKYAEGSSIMERHVAQTLLACVTAVSRDEETILARQGLFYDSEKKEYEALEGVKLPEIDHISIEPEVEEYEDEEYEDEEYEEEDEGGEDAPVIQLVVDSMVKAVCEYVELFDEMGREVGESDHEPRKRGQEELGEGGEPAAKKQRHDDEEYEEMLIDRPYTPLKEHEESDFVSCIVNDLLNNVIDTVCDESIDLSSEDENEDVIGDSDDDDDDGDDDGDGDDGQGGGHNGGSGGSGSGSGRGGGSGSQDGGNQKQGDDRADEHENQNRDRDNSAQGGGGGRGSDSGEDSHYKAGNFLSEVVEAVLCDEILETLEPEEEQYAIHCLENGEEEAEGLDSCEDEVQSDDSSSDDDDDEDGDEVEGVGVEVEVNNVDVGETEGLIDDVDVEEDDDDASEMSDEECEEDLASISSGEEQQDYEEVLMSNMRNEDMEQGNGDEEYLTSNMSIDEIEHGEGHEEYVAFNMSNDEMEHSEGHEEYAASNMSNDEMEQGEEEEEEYLTSNMSNDHLAPHNLDPEADADADEIHMQYMRNEHGHLYDESAEMLQIRQDLTLQDSGINGEMSPDYQENMNQYGFDPTEELEPEPEAEIGEGQELMYTNYGIKDQSDSNSEINIAYNISNEQNPDDYELEPTPYDVDDMSTHEYQDQNDDDTEDDEGEDDDEEVINYDESGNQDQYEDEDHDSEQDECEEQDFDEQEDDQEEDEELEQEDNEEEVVIDLESLKQLPVNEILSQLDDMDGNQQHEILTMILKVNAVRQFGPITSEQLAQLVQNEHMEKLMDIREEEQEQLEASDEEDDNQEENDDEENDEEYEDHQWLEPCAKENQDPRWDQNIAYYVQNEDHGSNVEDVGFDSDATVVSSDEQTIREREEAAVRLTDYEKQYYDELPIEEDDAFWEDVFCPRPLSPETEKYKKKHEMLEERYVDMLTFTRKLRHRVYEVKKEISRVKRMKRVIMNRLDEHGDDYASTVLEIPPEQEIIDNLAAATLALARKASATPLTMPPPQSTSTPKHVSSKNPPTATSGIQHSKSSTNISSSPTMTTTAVQLQKPNGSKRDPAILDPIDDYPSENTILIPKKTTVRKFQRTDSSEGSQNETSLKLISEAPSKTQTSNIEVARVKTSTAPPQAPAPKSVPRDAPAWAKVVHAKCSTQPFDNQGDDATQNTQQTENQKTLSSQPVHLNPSMTSTSASKIVQSKDVTSVEKHPIPHPTQAPIVRRVIVKKSDASNQGPTQNPVRPYTKPPMRIQNVTVPFPVKRKKIPKLTQMPAPTVNQTDEELDCEVEQPKKEAPTLTVIVPEQLTVKESEKKSENLNLKLMSKDDPSTLNILKSVPQVPQEQRSDQSESQVLSIGVAEDAPKEGLSDHLGTHKDGNGSQKLEESEQTEDVPKETTLSSATSPSEAVHVAKTDDARMAVKELIMNAKKRKATHAITEVVEEKTEVKKQCVQVEQKDDVAPGP